MFYIQNLQAPYLVVRVLSNYAPLAIPTLDRTFYYGYIEEINYATVIYAPGDIVLFKKEEQNPAFDNDSQQYWVISEQNIFYIAESTATKIFDITFDYTFE